jgi:hypothetical protein
MGATSVTGVSGPGDSEGQYKPENSSGCCGGRAPETTDSEPETIVVNDNIRVTKGCGS